MKPSIFIIIISIVLSGCIPRIGNTGLVKSDGEFVEGKVISGFPNLPLFPDAKVVESYGDGENFGAVFNADEKLEKVVNFYGPALEETGWEYSLRQESTTNYVFDFKNAENQGQIIVNTASDGKTTAISVFAEPR